MKRRGLPSKKSITAIKFSGHVVLLQAASPEKCQAAGAGTGSRRRFAAGGMNQVLYIQMEFCPRTLAQVGWGEVGGGSHESGGFGAFLGGWTAEICFFRRSCTYRWSSAHGHWHRWYGRR